MIDPLAKDHILVLEVVIQALAPASIAPTAEGFRPALSIRRHARPSSFYNASGAMASSLLANQEDALTGQHPRRRYTELPQNFFAELKANIPERI
jgi:hypothetical protein